MLFRDYFDASSTKIPRIGKSLYLLGHATDGPLYEPIYVERLGDILRTFNSGELVDAAKDALSFGGSEIDLYLVRVGGSYAMEHMKIFQNGEMVIAAHLRSRYAGTKYNGIKINRDINHLTFSAPATKETISLGYSWDDFPTLGMLAGAINNDTRLGRNHVYMTPVFEHIESAELIFANPNLELTKGSDGAGDTREIMYDSFAIGYSALEGRTVDYVMPVGVYFDDDDVNLFHLQLLKFCMDQSKISVMPHGIIGIKPTNNLVSANDYYNNLIQRTRTLKRHGLETSQTEDTGMYLSIVAGEYENELLHGSLAPIYAALVAGAPYPKNLVMKPVDLKLKFEFTPEQIRTLAENGITCMRNSVYAGTAVVASPVTAALPRMESHHLCSVGGLQASLHSIREVLGEVLGSNTLDIIKIKEIETSITRTLRILQNNGIISNYRVNSVYYQESDHLVVHWDIQPINSVQYIGMNCDIAFRRQ